MKKLIFSLISILLVNIGNILGITISTSQNWSTSGIISSDVVIITNGAVLTVDGNFTCNQIQIGNASTAGTLSFLNSSSSLTVTNASNTGNVTFNTGVGTIDMTNGGTFTFDRLVYSGSGSANAVLIPGTGTIQMNCPLTNYILPSSTSFRTFYNLILNPASTKTITFYATGSPAYTINNNLTKQNSGATTIGTCTLSVSGNILVSAGTLTFSGSLAKSIAGNLTLSGGTFANTNGAGNTTVTGNFITNGGTYSSTGGLTVSGQMLNQSGTCTISNTGALTIAGTTTIDGTLSWTSNTGTKTFSSDVTISTTGNVVCTTTRTFTFGSNLIIDGSITPSTGVFTFSNASANVTGTSSSPALGSVAATNQLTLNTTNDLTINGSITGSTVVLAANKTLNVKGSVSPTTFTVNNTGSKVIYNGTGAQTVKGTSYNNLEINKSTGTATFSGTFPSISTISLTAGTVALSSSTITLASGTDMIVQNAIVTRTGGTENTSGNYTITGSGSYTASSGTYNMSGTSKNITGTFTLGNVNMTGTYTNNNTLIIVGSFTGTGGTLTQAASSSLELRGGTTNACAITTLNATANGNTVNYNKTTSQTVKNTTYYNLTISGTKTTGIVTISGFTINGTYTNNTTFTTGSFTTSGTATFTGTTSITGTGEKTELNNLTISSGTLTGFSDTLILTGDFSNSGSYNHNNGTLLFFKTSGTQSIGGSGTTNFYNLIINHPTSGGAQLTGAVNLYHSLDLLGNVTSFNVNTGSLTLKSTGLSNDESARIGALDSSKTFTGTITWERYIGGNTTWRQIGCPIAGKTLADWEDGTNFYMTGFGSQPSAGGFVSIYYYNETLASLDNDFDSGWVAPTALTNSISFGDFGGKGYSAYVGQTDYLTAMTPFTMSMSGSIYTGNQPITLSNGNPGVGYATSETGYHLIANPYTSQIDIAASGWTNIDGYYSLDPSTGNFDFYDLGSQTGSGTATGIVAQGQAILLYTNTNNNSITFSESMKTKSGGSENFLRVQKANALELKITSNKNSLSDKTRVLFDNGNTNYEYASGDAKKINSPDKRAPHISTLSTDGVYLFQNNYSDLNTDFYIPVNVFAPSAGEYTISGNGINFGNKCLTLVDKENGTKTNLNSDFIYRFSTNDKQQFTNRFFITNTNCNDSAPINNQILLKDNQNNQNLNVEVLNPEKVNGELFLISMNGQTVFNIKNQVSEENFSIPLNEINEGIYILKFVSNSMVTSRKIIIRK